MANVEIPKWLRNLPLAPEFRPTETEFADPIAYISKIEKEASAFGICKVIPPLPKPSKRYVLSNLKRSLLKSRELGLDVNIIDAGFSFSEGRSLGSEGNAVFTTRQQELGQIGKRGRDSGCMPQSAGQKQVWQSGEVYTLEQFESKSKAFSRSVLGGIKEVTPQVIEKLFWKANSQKPIYVEYANDVPGSGFGEPNRLLNYFHGRKRRRRSCFMQQDLNTVRDSVSGVGIEVSAQSSYSFLEQGKECSDRPTSISNETSPSTKQSVSYANGDLEGTAGWKLSNSPWNLQVIARSAGSLTRFLLDDIPGVTSPMVYIGMLFSWFAWHVEDHELHSLNFLHMGSPKTWYAVPGDYAFAFEEIIRTQAYGGDIDHLAALKLIGEKTTLLSPELVVAAGIPCCRLVQNPGEFVVTFPRAYHVGFSHGFNCGEAANFGTPQWLTLAKDAAVRRAAMGHLPMLSHQQLLYLLTMSFIPRVPRSLLPGVRSSRLKDRLKEERELLVKKAFIEDVMKENKLLNTLSERFSAFRAVLWHPDLLPSVAKGSIAQTGTALYSGLDKDNELAVTAVKNSNQDDHVHQLTSDVETVNDLCNSDDLSCDFQVDAGALACVACGILGYPLMSVIQPSMKAATQLIPGDHFKTTDPVEIRQKPKSSYLQDLTKFAISATDVDETWNTHGFLRPRFFCLEHAVQIEELLRPKGGAKMLVICHSDYQKIKVNASTVAEEIRTAFNFEEVQLDTASMEELSLIDVAIDGEQFTDFQEDWTSRLGMNLRHSIEVRTSSPSRKIGVLNPDYLRSVFAPGAMISSIKWFSRKSRTRRESNYLKHSKSCGDNHSNKDETIDESGSSLKGGEKVLLQYSRRKYRPKSRYLEANRSSRSSVVCLAEATNANCGTVDACEQEPSFCDDPLILGDSRLEEKSNRAKHNLAADKCHYLPAASLLAIEKAVTFVNNNIQVDTDLVEEANELMTRSSPKEQSNKHQNVSVSDISDSAYYTTNNAEIMGSSVVGKECTKLEVHGLTISNMSETQCVNETHKNGISTCMESTTTVELNIPTLPKKNHKGMKRAITNAKVLSLNRSKKAREVEQTEGHNDYVRSPCEGLRPRKKQENPTTCKSSSNTPSEQKQPSKMFAKKSSRSSISRTEVTDGKSSPSYKCNLEGCRMCFKTKTELSLHKRNKCHYEECGKRFRSHKYVVLHQRVHDDKRPLKCTWKGCGMTFKWAWARTEHMRLHTGERPYECKIEGCGLTFRFVSDFSRHRRKMGHYLNIL